MMVNETQWNSTANKVCKKIVVVAIEYEQNNLFHQSKCTMLMVYIGSWSKFYIYGICEHTLDTHFRWLKTVKKM